MINLLMGKFQPDPENPKSGIGVEVSIWSPQSAWFKGIEDGDEVVVLGMCKTSTAPLAATLREVALRHLPNVILA